MNASGSNCRENWDSFTVIYPRQSIHAQLWAIHGTGMAPGWRSDTTNLPFLFPSVLLRRKGERKQFSVVMQLIYFSVPAQICWLKYILGGARGKGREWEGSREGITGVERRQNCKTDLQMLALPSGSRKRHPYGQQHASKLHALPKTYCAWTA